MKIHITAASLAPCLAAILSIHTLALDSSVLRKIVNHQHDTILKETLPASHPDYPVLAVLNALDQEEKGQYEKVIHILEPLRENILYQGVDETITKERKNLIVSFVDGSVGGFAIWRELAYLLLGRAYYQKGWYKEARAVFSGIPKESRYHPMAMLALGWTFIALRENIPPEIDMPEINMNDVFQKELAIEARLLRATLHLKNTQLDQAIELVEPIMNGAMLSVLSDELKFTAFKIFAEAKYRNWIAHSSEKNPAEKDSSAKDSQSWNFEKKTSLLQEVVQVFQKLPPAQCDAQCAFFIAEVYWNLASVYRIEDPAKYHKDALSALENANRFLKPWAQLSIKNKQTGKKAAMTEEAYFLSIAVLMEQGEESQAIARGHEFTNLYPMGSYREDVYQILGDYYFQKTDFGKSVLFYRELVKIATPEKAFYGMYKAAWSFYNLGQPWKALRHIERIILSARKVTAPTATTPAFSALDEVRNDLFVFLAELMPNEKAQEELKVFQYGHEESVHAVERLAQSYKSIGKFGDAISLYKQLLTENKKNQRTFDWLTELLDATLRAAWRKEIPRAMETFLSALPNPDDKAENRAENKPENKTAAEKHAALEALYGNLVLTLHRETLKTGDPDISQVTNEAYRVFNKLYRHSKQGSVWYRGAQKLEERDPLASLEWYQKAAEIKDFENHTDAGLSVLRILKIQSDQLSLKKENNQRFVQEIYGKIYEYSKWYRTLFPGTTQTPLAELMELESLFHLGNDKVLGLRLGEILKLEPLKIVFSYYYRAKRWSDLYFLSADLMKKSGENPAEKSTEEKKHSLLATLRLTAQESAFQAAFTSKNKPESRAWYEKASLCIGRMPCDLNSAQEELTLKAWHNLIVSYDRSTEAHELVAKYLEFVPPKTGTSKLLFEIGMHAAAAFETLADDLKKADALIFAISFRPSSIEKDEIRWQAARSYAMAEELESFMKHVELLRLEKSPLIFEPESRQTIINALLTNHQPQKAWEELAKWLSDPGVKPESTRLLLFRDIYLYAKAGARPELLENMQAWLKKNRPTLIDNPLLFDLWVDVDAHMHEELMATIKKITEEDLSVKKSDQASDELSVRLKQVQETFADFEKQISRINAYLKIKTFQIQQSAICTVPNIRMNAIRKLRELRIEPLSSLSFALQEKADWNNFFKKLDEKITGFSHLQEKESALCKRESRLAAYMKPAGLCRLFMDSQESCQHPVKSNLAEIQKIRSDPAYQVKTNKHKIELLLASGGRAHAKQVATAVKDPVEKAYLTALIRLNQEDPWTAYQLLDPIRNSNNKLSLSVDKTLSDWETKWLQEISRP